MGKKGRRDNPHYEHQMGPRTEEAWRDYVRALYLRSFDRLDEVAREPAPDLFDRLECSLHLRHLFIDRDKLFDSAQEGKAAVTFEARPMHGSQLQKIPGTNRYGDRYHADCLYPPVPCGDSSSPRRLNRDQWLAFEVGAKSTGASVSVKDVIKTSAHFLGGVHHRPPQDSWEEGFFLTMVDADRGLPGVGHMLLMAITRVTLAGLRANVEEMRAGGAGRS